MSFLTFDEIRNASFTESFRKSEGVSGCSVFLSHSSKDDHYVNGVETFLRSFGATVYSDNSDNRLPKDPSPKTADILRSEIKKAQRFVVLISEKSSTSGWIPWELGFADGDKTYKNIALLPISDTSIEESWATREYLGLYPVIRKTGIKGREGEYWVVQEAGSQFADYLSSWLKNGK